MTGAVDEGNPRQRWMGVLARAGAPVLEAALAALPWQPVWHLLRPAEAGMVMVRARAGGTGGRFNLGEMTVTRCAVQVEGGAAGLAYVAGRDRRHAELAALFDALLQDDDRRPELEARVVAPLARAQAEAAELASRKAAATKVEFLNLVRGEDPG